MKDGLQDNKETAMYAVFLSAYPRTIVGSKQRSRDYPGISLAPLALIHARDWTLTLRSKVVNPITEERVNGLVQLLRETNPSENLADGEASDKASPQRFDREEQWTLDVLERTCLLPRLVERAKQGQLIWDEEYGSELAKQFCDLTDEDQEKLWANVALEADRENWLAGGPGDEIWTGNRKPKKPPMMSPPISRSAELSLEVSLNHLDRVRVKGNEWHSLCPAHSDRHTRSLIISESKYKPGEPVFFCYSGCTHKQVKTAVMVRING